MKFTEYLHAFIIVALILVLSVLVLGLIAPSTPIINGNFVSDNWFHIAHPNWAIGCSIALVALCVPEKYLYFWRKTKA